VSPPIAPSIQALRPLTIPDIIDQSVRAWRRQWGPLFRLFLVTNLLTYLLSKGILYAVAGLSTGLEAAEASPRLLLDMLAALGMIAALMLAIFWIFFAATLVASHLVVHERLGTPVSLGTSVRRLLQRSPVLLGNYILSLLVGAAGSFIAAIPGIALTAGLIFLLATSLDKSSSGAEVIGGVLGGLFAVVCMSAVVVWYFVRFMLMPVVVGFENGSVLESHRRSGKLVGGKTGVGFTGRSFVRAGILLTVAFAILFGVGMVAGLPALVIQFAYGNPFGGTLSDRLNVPQHLLIPAELFQVGIQAIFAPLSAVIAGVFYVDQRVRREGLDLELKLDALRPPT
jgi:hypothetical protein